MQTVDNKYLTHSWQLLNKLISTYGIFRAMLDKFIDLGMQTAVSANFFTSFPV